MIRRKGNPALIAKYQAEALQFHGLDGDGCQAPGAIVIHKSDSDRHPFVVHFANTQSGGYHGGSYCETINQAIGRFNERKGRYDPTGDLHRSFNTPEVATEGEAA